MSPRFSSRSSRTSALRTRTSALRTRASVLAAGLGVSVALGAGVAAAATPAVATPATVVHTQTVAAKKKAVSWVDPVKKYKLTAGFAQAGAMWQATHSGQDFAVPSGTNVMAAHGGTVVKAGGNGAGDGPAYGNAIVIRHGSGTYSQYAHLSRVDVRVGQIVRTGQHIALSGNTGNTTGPHLHFEIRTTPDYGSAVNPVTFLRSQGVTV
ncbi:murein DD-endopeptidase MepM/ murein hydrolase activator NlpD [Streptomyces sp. LBL]|uniref:M23 family metallopeptidase n=1 Tax=Streptomyces sp. LBL TaxID=2940562 RepID=UPI0024731516|nr:M23 family metallopeptidase [Streptomyces sp. LBL]MDH6626559.1 murein DD-endopeptidase MepM/ murein hydrolase activator NlpD [Streptomyces sp. LBL]